MEQHKRQITYFLGQAIGRTLASSTLLIQICASRCKTSMASLCRIHGLNHPCAISTLLVPWPDTRLGHFAASWQGRILLHAKLRGTSHDLYKRHNNQELSEEWKGIIQDASSKNARSRSSWQRFLSARGRTETVP